MSNMGLQKDVVTLASSDFDLADSDFNFDDSKYKESKSKTYNTLKKDLRIKKLEDGIDRDKKDHELKLTIAYFLLGLLSIQAIIIFVLVFFEGFDVKKFYLDNYIFYILISGTLIESYFLVRIVVEHLFPKIEKDK
ncbi:MAG: hypothetical protein U9O66_02775 [Patescibacteria group bacterium]|nr:hypothetical protein [Patescibacteria group bacterium]